MKTDDKELARIIREVADELHIDINIVEKVYYHYIGMLYDLMTAVKYRYLTPELKKKNAVNISIPGFGRILHRYGKTYRRRSNTRTTINTGTNTVNNSDINNVD